MPILKKKRFSRPILYLIEFDTLDEAHRRTTMCRGPVSAMFTTNLIAAETFLSHRRQRLRGSLIINIGPAAAENWRGVRREKDTGGGRNRQRFVEGLHLRRQTNTVKLVSPTLPLGTGDRVQVGVEIFSPF